MVSRYENNFTFNPNLDEDCINEEFFIAVNGPSLALCNGIVVEAMQDYWRKEKYIWHFTEPML